MAMLTMTRATERARSPCNSRSRSSLHSQRRHQVEAARQDRAGARWAESTGNLVPQIPIGRGEKTCQWQGTAFQVAAVSHD